jgi:hypothetical protein
MAAKVFLRSHTPGFLQLNLITFETDQQGEILADEKQSPGGQQSSHQQTGQPQDRKPNQKQDDHQQQKGQPCTQSDSQNRDENQGQADETGNRKASADGSLRPRPTPGLLMLSPRSQKQ